jgi:E3 Ubiquitin ligase
MCHRVSTVGIFRCTVRRVGTLISLVCVSLGLYSLIRRATRWRDNSPQRSWLARLRHIQIAPIADVEEGREVKIQGRVRLRGEGFVTPCARHACAVYEAYAHDRRDGCGDVLGRVDERADFVVEDETGAVVVRVSGAKLLLYPTHLRQQPLGGGKDADVAEFFRVHAKVEPAIGALLYVEAALRDGDLVQVLGFATCEQDDARQPSQLHRQPAARLVLAAMPDKEMIISSYSPHDVRLFSIPNRTFDQGALDAIVAQPQESPEEAIEDRQRA